MSVSRSTAGDDLDMVESWFICDATALYEDVSSTTNDQAGG